MKKNHTMSGIHPALIITIAVMALLAACNSKATEGAVDTEIPPAEFAETASGTTLDAPTPNAGVMGYKRKAHLRRE